MNRRSFFRNLIGAAMLGVAQKVGLGQSAVGLEPPPLAFRPDDLGPMRGGHYNLIIQDDLVDLCAGRPEAMMNMIAGTIYGGPCKLRTVHLSPTVSVTTIEPRDP